MRFILRGLLHRLLYHKTFSEDDLTKRLLQEVAKWACIFEEKECQQIANDRLKEYLEDPPKHKLPSAWKQWTYCQGAMIADKSVLLKLEDLHVHGLPAFNYISCDKHKSNGLCMQGRENS
ncbi:hypothetical protein DMN91_003907 [Ooceraea biroi]|uniref:Uncharacterized protein n=1 Tax=Ooceraea biroi TaxID=2015173 RepID=A0A3L8DTJ0_OOCBI|nr:hypothetical protein DMN91_003907 [Ooceraea biroi]